MRIGLFGGMFDPPHIGHVSVMRDVSKALGLDVMCMVPCFDPPHRNDSETSFLMREMLCESALHHLRGHEGTRFLVSDVESHLDLPNYTYNTIEAIKAESDGELFLVLGEDEYASFPNWRFPDRIIAECEIVCAMRSGSGEQPRQPMDGERVTFVSVDEPEGISSTMIRERLRRGEDVDGLIPDGVKSLIYILGLYGVEPSIDYVKRTTGIDVEEMAKGV